MNSLESKLQPAKNFLGSLDTALREKNEDHTVTLIKDYIKQSVLETSPVELAHAGSLLLEGYLALNSHKTVLDLGNLDKIFGWYIQTLEKLQASGKRPEVNEIVISNAKEIYTEKKVEVLQYEAGDDLEAGMPDGGEKVNYGKILSAVKKYNEACELSKTTDAQKKNLATIGNDSFRKYAIREAIMQYGLAGKKPSEVLEKLSWAFMGQALDAFSKSENDTGDIWYARYEDTEKLLQHFKGVAK